MKRAVQMLVLLCVLALVVVMAGCGGGNDGPGEMTMDTAPGPQPRVSPTATVSRIAYVAGLSAAQTIYTMAPDGSGKTALRAGSDPAWSPDGSMIAYAAPVTAPDGSTVRCISIMDAAGSVITQLTSPTVLSDEQGGGWANDRDPDWSPDGQYVIFTRGSLSYGHRPWIYLVPVAGGDPTELVFVDTSDTIQDPRLYVPTWRPGGNEIVYHFYGKVDGVYVNELRMLTVDNGIPSVSTLLLAAAGHPAWSNDGSRLAFRIGSELGLFTASFANGALDMENRVKVTNGDHSKPTWDPTGQTIAYFGVGAKAPYWDVFTVPAGGGKATNLTNTRRADEGSPDWQPTPGGGGNQPPIANAGPDQTVAVDQDVSFDGSGSYDPDGTIVSYDWDFGDGSSDSGVAVTHSYPFADVYTVTLTVVDNDGAHARDTCQVTVTSGGAPGGVHVSGITWATSGPHLVVTVSVSADSAPVGGAVVAMTLSMGTGSWSFIGTTDAAGRVSFMHKRAAKGTYTATVTSITHDLYGYDPGLDVGNPSHFTL